MTTKQSDLTCESVAVQTHLSIIQNIIQRMSSNSSSCKAWCISLVSAILVVVADKTNPDYAWIALIPASIFACLDAYYLALEKQFRNSYNKFIKKAHSDNLTPEDLYSVSPVGDATCEQLKAIASFSIWGFYLTLIVMIAAVRFYVMDNDLHQKKQPSNQSKVNELVVHNEILTSNGAFLAW